MSEIDPIFDSENFKSQLEKLASWEMPFGKYAGRVLIDLPEAYLFWFQKKDWPNGELGELMALALELKVSGTAGLVKKLKNY
ncbi:MAG: DUF3820 family protein [Arenicella sp.]